MDFFTSKLPVKAEEELRVCRGCLATDSRLFDIRENTFAEFTGLAVFSGALCTICLHLLRKSNEFRMRCLNVDRILKRLQPLNADNLSSVDRTDLKPSLITTKTLTVDCGSTILEHEKEASILVKTENEEGLSVTWGNLAKDNENKMHDLTESNNTDIVMCDDEDNDEKSEVKKQGYSRVVKVDNLSNLLTQDDNMQVEINSSETHSFSSVDFDDENDYKNDDIEIKKNKRSCKKTEGLSSIDKLIIEIKKLYDNIWKSVSNDERDFYAMFETLYKQSLNKERAESIEQSEWNHNIKTKNRSVSENIVHFLDLYKKIADHLKIDVHFLSIEEQRRDMDGKRQTCTAEQCELCCKNYLTHATYDRHKKMYHNESFQFGCVVCLYTFKKQSEYAFHLLKVHATKKICKQCGLTIANNRKGHWLGVRGHMQSYHSGELTHCEFCGRGFRLLKNCYLHIRQVHSDQINTVQCLFCGDSYNGPVGLRNHVNRIHQEAVKCSTCSVYFADQGSLAKHAGEGGCRKELSGCPLCGATFPTEPLMREHYDHAHAVYKCTKCVVTFVELKSYLQHCRKLCREELARAPPPPRGAGRGARGAPRKRDKPQNKAFVCDVCGKEYYIAAHLRYHQRIHTGEKPHECDHCHKTFRTGTTLLVHRWTHTGERRYKCKFCPKAFRQSSHLKAHMPSHTNEKNYACTLCTKRFTSSVVLRQHVRTVHEGLSPVRRRRQKNVQT